MSRAHPLRIRARLDVSGAQRIRTRFSALIGFSLLSAVGISSVSAQPLDGAFAVAPSGAGQQALAVRASAKGVTARVCIASACSPDGGAALDVPAEVRPLLGKARIAPVVLANGRSLIRVDVPGGRETERWVMLIAAPLTGRGDDPIVLFSGLTGALKGEHGEGRSTVVLEEKLGKGSRIVIGEQREDVTICGRPTVVSATEIDPSSMTIAPRASVQNLPLEERAKAIKLTAARAPEPRAPGAVRLLRATAASSAIEKKFGTLTDGDLKTAWVEAKAGDGRGEFVSMSSASEVGITSIDIAIRPEADGAAPRRLFLATLDRLFEVTIPDDGVRKAGGVYEVKMPEELRTSCLSVVLEEAYAARGEQAPRVGIAEVSARTALGDLDEGALAGALAGGGERAKAAAALLARGGSAATKAATLAYGKLDEEGKRLALGVIDAAPCSEHIKFFAGLIAMERPDERAMGRNVPLRKRSPEEIHALDRIRRCGRAAAQALAELITSSSDQTKVLVARELALIAPAEAVPVLLDAMPNASEAVRRELRTALAHAAKSERSKRALALELELEQFKARPLAVEIDLLRAIGPRLSVTDGSASAFGHLAVPDAVFSTRYLLLSPAAELARSGDARAEAFLRSSLRTDADPHVRARAAEVAALVPSFAVDLVASVNDKEPRVRETALSALAKALAAGMKPTATMPSVLAGRLASEPWTFVRAAAAAAMGALPAGPSADGALAAALSDASPDVRGRALDALGSHRASSYAEQVRDRFQDKEEHIEVRARAILALAAMCDKASIDAWTTFAHRAARPLDEKDRRLGSAAVAALGIMRPADLQKRLAPLLSKDAPPGVRETARAALSAVGGCR